MKALCQSLPIYSSPQVYLQIIFSVLYMKKLRHREVKLSKVLGLK